MIFCFYKKYQYLSSEWIRTSLSQRRTWKIQTSVDNQNTVGYQYKSSGRQWCTSTLASFIHWFFSWRGRDGCLKWTELSARDKYVGIMPSLFMHSSENRITINETICLRSRTTSTVIASSWDCFFWKHQVLNILFISTDQWPAFVDEQVMCLLKRGKRIRREMKHTFFRHNHRPRRSLAFVYCSLYIEDNLLWLDYWFRGSSSTTTALEAMS